MTEEKKTSLQPQEKRWLCCQLGTRMHYAVPRILHEAGRLELFYTDLYAAPSSTVRLFARMLKPWFPTPARQLLGRVASGVPKERVRSYSIFGTTYFFKKNRARNSAASDDIYHWAGRTFCTKIVRDGFGEANAVFAYNTAALELLRAARRNGFFTVLEQTIAPREIEDELLAEGMRRYPGWDDRMFGHLGAAVMAKRERDEWEHSDLILCGSEFVRQGIGRCGGPIDRCVVVPYGVDGQFTPSLRTRKDHSLRVLTVGQVALRKGAGCVTQVAQVLGREAVFRWAGPVGLPAAARTAMEQHVALIGAVPESELHKSYDWADVFFLPSICEGSATVIYEALSCGLPVLTTPNSGSPVREGVDGFVVPVYDISAMTKRLGQLNGDRILLQRLSEGAAANARSLSLMAYQNRLLTALSFPLATNEL